MYKYLNPKHYKTSTNRPSSVLLTLANLCPVNPLMVLSHCLLLNPDCAFKVFKSIGELALSILNTDFRLRLILLVFSRGAFAGSIKNTQHPTLNTRHPFVNFSPVCQPEGDQTWLFYFIKPVVHHAGMLHVDTIHRPIFISCKLCHNIPIITLMVHFKQKAVLAIRFQYFI